MNNTARSIKISILAAALVLGLAQFLINIQPQAANARPADSRKLAPVQCTTTSCWVDPDALIADADHPTSISFDRDGVSFFLYDHGRFTGEKVIFTQTDAVIPASAMSDKPCSSSCPGTCETLGSREYCFITFTK